MKKGLVPLVCWDGTICKMSLFLQYWHYCWYLFPRQLDQGSIFSKKCWDSCQPFGFSPAKCWVWFKIPMSLTSFYNVDFLIPQEGYPRASFVGISLHDMKTQSKIPQWRLHYLIEIFSSRAWWDLTHLQSISLLAVLAFVWLPDNQARAMFYLRSVEAFVNFFGFSPAKCWVWFKIPIILISCCIV